MRLFDVVVLFLASLATGCATLVSGNVQEVEIRSYPAGARGLIRSSNGLVQEIVTPARVALPTGAEHVVELEAPGHRRTAALVGKTINWWSVLGGPGAFFDWVSGAIYDLDPGVLDVRLAAAAPPPPPPPASPAAPLPPPPAPAAPPPPPPAPPTR